MTQVDASSLRARVNQITWYHQIDLGHGITTPGVEDSAYKLGRLGLPASLGGKSVLDIGSWDGFFAFEAERRGADRVLATDSFAWSGTSWGSKAGFTLAREVLGSSVSDQEIDVMEMSPDRLGTHDVVLFLGVLYHMRHPLLALERAASVTRERLVVETVADLVGVRAPAMAFYPGRELNNDPTNWWAPNLACLEGMLRDVGFSRVERITRIPSAPYRAARAVYHRWTGRNAVSRAFRQERVVMHAFRS
jgi:tRNA (mo5U34)-methyltransferase